MEYCVKSKNAQGPSRPYTNDDDTYPDRGEDKATDPQALPEKLYAYLKSGNKAPRQSRP